YQGIRGQRLRNTRCGGGLGRLTPCWAFLRCHGTISLWTPDISHDIAYLYDTPWRPPCHRDGRGFAFPSCPGVSSRHDAMLMLLHYAVEESDTLRALFASLRCLEYDASQTRWVWLYTEEARTLPFKDRRAANKVVLGEFVFKGPKEIVLNLRSFARATNALVFFDHHIPRTVAHVTAMTVSNRLLSTAEATSLGSLDQYFDHAEVVVKDPAALLQTLEDLKYSIPDAHERLAVVARYMEDKAKQPVPAMERFPLDYDDEGIRAVEALLVPHTVIAMHHWQGHTDYTRHDLMRDMLRHGDSQTGDSGRLFTTQPSGETPLS